ncbi:MAG: hypothetical protein QOF62_2218 [Pyrinomonadaceae bacterium]|nr:hypothetical protein [Pyrinomonadaceae bacterium]
MMDQLRSSLTAKNCFSFPLCRFQKQERGHARLPNPELDKLESVIGVLEISTWERLRKSTNLEVRKAGMPPLFAGPIKASQIVPSSAFELSFNSKRSRSRRSILSRKSSSSLSSKLTPTAFAFSSTTD